MKTEMKKIICKVEYDTEASELIQKKTSGNPGDKRMSAAKAAEWQNA